MTNLPHQKWVKWWGAIDEVDSRAGGTIRIPGKPWRFSGEQLDHPGLPAYRGEHNREVLQELGLTDQAILSLADKGILTNGVPV
ncbi:MAG: hypothetical protein Q7T97_04000 [Burkholderiaceae bacterium]|nr:hypothetical protein [Burkholderiaceae bacterium]